MENAIPPSSAQVFSTFRKIIKPKSDIEQATDEQQLIAGLSGDPRWEAFKKEFEAEIEAINKMQGQDLDGLSVEAIGFKFLACRAVIAKLSEMMVRPDGYARVANGK